MSALPFRAYAKIFNEYYRDQDLVTELTVSTASGADSTTSTTLQNVAWEKDYFTTARPWALKGPDINLPLGISAPVYGETVNGTTSIGHRYQSADGGGVAEDFTMNMSASGVPTGPASIFNNTGLSLGTADDYAAAGSNYDPPFADLSSATSASILELREAMALQRYQEARARYGSRYTEYLRYLGVRSSDARLQRPEYLGGGKQTIQFSEVLQTAPDATSGNTGTTGVGALKGHGIGSLRSNRYRKFFEEHGYIVTMMSVLPKTIYSQGLSRTWNRRTKEDFYQKELAHIGQQEVLNKEVYAAHATPSGTFGFQDRYDEYRRTESSIAGEFRTTLNHWHMARIFSSDPTLNSSFVTSNPTNRVYASTSTNQLYMLVNHSIQARRLISPVGTSFGL